MLKMQAPVDYPIQDAARTTQFSMDELTYSVLLDRIDTRPQQPSEQTSKISVRARKNIAEASAPRLRPLFKPFAAATQSLLSNQSALKTVNTNVFFRWGRAQR